MSRPVPPDIAFMTSSPAHFMSLGFGAGLSPAWPGTVGAVLGLPLYLLILPLGLWAGLAAYGALFALFARAAGLTGAALGVADHNAIVSDEIWAMALVLHLGPQGVYWWLPAFLLFRLFDIAKPWPIRTVDRNVKGGFGVMLDDALAALFSLGVLYAAHAALRLAGA